MTDPYGNVVGGKLAFKRGKPQKSKKVSNLKAEESHKDQDTKKLEVVEKKTENSSKKRSNDVKTKAEIEFERVREEREADELKKRLKRSHRERIDEFNERLSSMSEHYDIPKIGPG